MNPIIRIAAKGDGVTADGQHRAGTVPGDAIADDGSILPGPHHQQPPCPYFGSCGGCQLQYGDDVVLADYVSTRVTGALAGQGIAPARIVHPPHLSPPGTRRRARLGAVKKGRHVEIGFRAERSHRLVPIADCLILHPAMTALFAPLQALLRAWDDPRLTVGVEMAVASQGVDCVISGLMSENLVQAEALADFARTNNLARLSLDNGYGPETLWEPNPVTVNLGGHEVPMPQGAFLQATEDGQQALIAAARVAIGGAATIADLFSGLGTFAYALAGPTKVLMAEAAQASHLAAKSGAERAQLPIFAMHRDLFRNPLQASELSKFEAVLIDPPRAGAREQVIQIAASSVKRLVYISCNPASWAKDVAILAEAGFRVDQLWPVGQFRWSTHVELASYLVRDPA